jgi:outer membrane receptor protein involved in Fe transport
VAQPPDFRYFLDSTIGDSLRTDIRRQGNPNIAFEKGNSYEFGLTHLFGEHVSANVVAFRKTLENVVSGNLQLGDVGTNGRFSAGDFGTVKGVELTMRARWTGVSVRAGWALQKATGVSSGLENDSIPPGDNPALNEFPLAFDRRHSGDFALFLGRGAGAETRWSLALTANVQSGYPLLDRRLPWTHSADLRASWDFARELVCDRCHWRVVFDGRNILGTENILALRSETGAIAPTLQRVQQLANAQPPLTEAIPRESPAYVELLDFNRDGLITPAEANAARFAAALDRFDPTLFFGEGRQIRFGVEVAF